MPHKEKDGDDKRKENRDKREFVIIDAISEIKKKVGCRGEKTGEGGG